MSKAFFDTYAKYAIEAGNAYGLNPLAILAVASLESANGGSKLAVNYRNHFGLKVSSFKPTSGGWDGVTKGSLSPEGNYYRAYQNIQQSFNDFGYLISKSSLYAKVKAASFNAESFAREIAYSLYHTSSRETYRINILSKMKEFEGYGLPTQATTIAGGVTGIIGILAAIYAYYKYGNKG